MRTIGDLFILIKYTCRYYLNFFKKHYFYGLVLVLLTLVFIFCLVEPIFVYESQYPSLIDFSKLKLFKDVQIVLFLNSIKVFYLFLVAALWDAAVLKTSDNYFNGLSHLPLTIGANHILAFITLLIGNLINLPLLLLLAGLWCHIFQFELAGIFYVFLLFLVFKYIFYIFMILACRTIGPLIRLRTAVTVAVLIVIAACYFLFFVSQHEFCANDTILALCETFGDTIGLIMPTFWLFNIFYGINILNENIFFQNFIYISILLLSAVYINTKIHYSSLFRFSFYEDIHHETKSGIIEQPAPLFYTESTPVQALVLRECMNYYWMVKTLICIVAVSSVFAYYYSEPVLPAYVIFVLLIYFINMTYKEWPLIIFLKSCPVNFGTIYLVKSLVSFIFNLCVMLLFVFLIYFLGEPKDLINVPDYFFLIIPLIWLKQFVIDLCVLFAGARNFYESIKTYTIIFSYFFFISFISALRNSYRHERLYSFILILAFFAIIHILVHRAAFRRFKKGEFWS